MLQGVDEQVGAVAVPDGACPGDMEHAQRTVMVRVGVQARDRRSTGTGRTVSSPDSIHDVGHTRSSGSPCQPCNPLLRVNSGIPISTERTPIRLAVCKHLGVVERFVAEQDVDART